MRLAIAGVAVIGLWWGVATQLNGAPEVSALLVGGLLFWIGGAAVRRGSVGDAGRLVSRLATGISSRVGPSATAGLSGHRDA